MSTDLENTIAGRADRPYRFESGTWGQSLDIFVKTGMLMITACDFDSGQTVRIGLSTSDIPGIITALNQAVVDAEAFEVAKDDLEKQQAEVKSDYYKARHDTRAKEREGN